MSGLRRSVKNAAKSYAPCERDVREATSSDKSSSPPLVNARIANACYDLASARLVMDMIWKRLHDSVKNWRHIYKALLLVEFLLKAGPVHVVAEIQKNVFAVQTLTTFAYVSAKSGVDKGMNVREAAANVLKLLQSEPLLRREREVGVRNHQRYTEVMGDKARAKAGPKQKGPQALAGFEPAPLPDQYGAPAAGAGVDAGAGSALAQQEARIMEETRRVSALQQEQEAAIRGGAQVPVVQHSQTEEEMIAMAQQMSLIEEQARRHQQVLSAQELEEEQLAIALSLSMAETDARLQGDSSCDEDDEVTPPSSPYQGTFFDPASTVAGAGAAGAAPALPSYDESESYASVSHGAPVLSTGMGAGMLPVSATGRHTIEIGSPDAAAAGIAELESYLSGTPSPSGRP